MPRFFQRLRLLHQPDPSKSILEKGRIFFPSSSVVNIPAPGAIAHMCWVGMPLQVCSVVSKTTDKGFAANKLDGSGAFKPSSSSVSSESLLALLVLSNGEDERVHSTPPWLGEELLEEASLDASWLWATELLEVEELLDNPSESVPAPDSAEALEDMNAFHCSNIESIRE